MSHAVAPAPAPARARQFALRFLASIVLLFGISVGLRVHRYNPTRITYDIAASYHVLLTVEALDLSSIHENHLLPIVSLARPFDRGVPFGAAVPDASGRYFYPSFPPLGFLAPWAFFKITHLAPTLEHLETFNFGVHLIAALLVAFLVFEALAGVRTSERTSERTTWVVVMLAAATYLFNIQALQAHGIVYWHHSLFQVAWLAQLIALMRLVRADEAGTSTRTAGIALAVASLLGPSVEWTGYIADAVVAGVLWWHGRSTRRYSWIILGTAACAGVGFLVHFAMFVGLGPLIAALHERASARSAYNSSLHALRLGYVRSFGLLLPFVGLVIVADVARRKPQAAVPRWLIALVVASVLPLVENILLLQHAVIYDFDRLKALVPLILIASLCVARMTLRLRVSAAVAWTALLVWPVVHPPNRSWGANPPLSANDALLRAVHAQAQPCAIYATDGYPRGWAILTVGANIYEAVPSVDSLARIVTARGACQGIYLPVDKDQGEGIYAWSRAEVYTPATSGAVARVDTIVDR